MKRLVKDALFAFVKGRLLHIKRASFAMQKVPFYNAKEHVLLSYMVFFIT